MPVKRWIKSANHAIEGILHAARSERHLRYHLYATVVILLLSFVLGLSRTHFALISVAVILVIFAEMVNSAIEYLVNFVSPHYNEKARVIKDVAAGAVLITAVGAAVLGYIVLVPYVREAADRGFRLPVPSPDEVVLLSFVIILIMVIMLKSFFGKGHPLRGGMPSGHAAIAFSAWAAVTSITRSPVASLISLILAVLVGQSRVAMSVHSLLEVCIGAVLGAGVTFLLFLIFQ
ncbi:MAG: phosphatase PAP2 family protein [Nitrospirales bacterium]|nr:phosphatase PAP2 family protein [Nitrospirales bacterium]